MAIRGPSLQATSAWSGPSATGLAAKGSRSAFHAPRAKVNRAKATRDGSYMAIRSPTFQANGARYVRNIYRSSSQSLFAMYCTIERDLERIAAMSISNFDL